eukprot:1161425-Pelagomonas_calceolata.AAC.11
MGHLAAKHPAMYWEGSPRIFPSIRHSVRACSAATCSCHAGCRTHKQYAQHPPYALAGRYPRRGGLGAGCFAGRHHAQLRQRGQEQGALGTALSSFSIPVAAFPALPEPTTLHSRIRAGPYGQGAGDALVPFPVGVLPQRAGNPAHQPQAGGPVCHDRQQGLPVLPAVQAHS